MRSLLLFSGTTEGRQLAGRMSRAGVPCTVCVATAYGQEVMPDDPGVTIREGRMDTEEMAALMSEGYACAADATHPFAQEVSRNIREAAAAAGIPYIRCARTTKEAFPENAVLLASMEEAAQFFTRNMGRIFVTTGSKELAVLTRSVDPARITARVLPDERSVALCREAGLSGAQIIAMQGPFSEEMNTAALRWSDAAYLLTKETGRAGGFDEKMRAAAACSVIPVIIRNPEKARADGYSVDETADLVLQYCGCSGIPAEQRKITLIGIGPGGAALRTEEANKALAEAEIVFGAKRVLDLIAADKKKVDTYDAERIAEYLADHSKIQNAAVVFSGDTGFYSGASRAIRTFEKSGEEVEITAVCGISSLSYFASRIGKPWQDWKIASAHGRTCAVVPLARKHPALFLLAESAESVRRIGRSLAEAQEGGILGALTVTYGYQLSCPEEEIRATDTAGLASVTREGLYVLLIEQKDPSACSLIPAIPDEAFERGKVPMTKAEVRALTVTKLRLTENAVFFDIGAGTGSVSIEAALLAPESRVFSIEENEEALMLLAKNRDRFGAENMTIVPGTAPEALSTLPAPTHVFIGGSGGRLREIVQSVLKMNPYARIVLTTVTLETLIEAETVLKTLPVTEPEICEVQVSRAVRRGRYHLMTALNPVFLISFRGFPV